MLRFLNFLINLYEENVSSTNKALGDAYETATALHLHSITDSIHNTDPDHLKRIADIKETHESAMKLLPPEKRQQALEYGKKSAEAYLESLKTNHNINASDINEVHHTNFGIDSLLGKKVDRNQNPHDIAIKTKSGRLHGASLKFREGTLANNTPNTVDSFNKNFGINTNIKKIWDEAKERLGISNLGNKELKDLRQDPNIRRASVETAKKVADHHAEQFNKASLDQQRNFLQTIMKSKPDLDYDYVNGQKGTSVPIKNKKHHQLVDAAESFNAKSFTAKHTGGGRVMIQDHLENHLVTIEHRPTHGPFVSIQTNTKYGTGKPKKEILPTEKIEQEAGSQIGRH